MAGTPPVLGAQASPDFVRPVRTAYVHAACGGETTISQAKAEVLARDPAYVSGVDCAACGRAFRCGPDGEFTWAGTDDKVGA